MTDPFAALLSAAQTAATAGQALQQQVADLTAQVAQLEAQIAAQQPGTMFGVCASSATEHASNAPFGAKVWRYYQQPGEPLGWPQEYTLGAAEVFAYSDQVSIPDKAAGKADAAFTAWCKAAPTDRDTYYCPNHEHDKHIAKGDYTAAQYVQAFQRLAGIAHATNPRVRMTVIYTDWCFKPASGRNWRDSWPGDSADLIGIDAYVSPAYTSLANMPGMFDAVTAAAGSVGKPWGVFETGVDNKAYSGQQRTDALTSLAQLIRAKGATVGAYFNRSNWVLSAAEITAWRAGQTG